MLEWLLILGASMHKNVQTTMQIGRKVKNVMHDTIVLFVPTTLHINVACVL